MRQEWRQTYSFSDIGLIPIKCSLIESRDKVKSHTWFLDRSLSLPIISAPMKSVTGPKLAASILALGSIGVLPRSDDFEQDRDMYLKVHNERAAATTCSLSSYSSIPLAYVSVPVTGNFKYRIEEYIRMGITNICLDVANGFHYLVREAMDQIRYFRPNNLHIITGNVGSIEGYAYLSTLGIDAIRVGIGNGASCFPAETRIITSQGNKNIEDVSIGDYVKSHIGTFRKVVNTIKRKEKRELISINNTLSTKNHEYYVVHKKYKNIITKNNIHQYAEWVSAIELTKDFLLIKQK